MRKQNMFYPALAIATALTAGLASTAIADGDDARPGPDDLKLQQAIDIALQQQEGVVVEAEFEPEDDGNIWEITVAASDSKHYEIEIDAATGNVLEIEAE